MIRVNVVMGEKNFPVYKTEGSAGMDIYSVDSMEPVPLGPLDRVLIKTGLFLEIPKGYEAQIRPRSGLALKKGLTVLNTPGTIDSDYRGEIGVILVNLSNSVQIINPGERIAQMVFTKVEKCILTPKNSLSETERGEGGFGSTGVE